MTKKNNNSKIKINQVEIEFTKKEITAYGGFSFLALFFNKIKLNEFIEKIIPIKEESNNSCGIYPKILNYFLTILSGGNRFSHILYLGESRNIFKKLFDTIKRLPSSATSLTRLFNKIKSWQMLEILGKELWDYVYDVIIPWQKIKEDYLTFDSSVITRYGRQEGAKVGYNPKKKGRPSHHPLMGFLNVSRYVVNLWNRAGNACSSENVVTFAEQTFERLKGKLNILGVLADSAFYDIDFIKYIESIRQKYIIAVKFYVNIQQILCSDLKWYKICEGIEMSEFFFCHKDEKWDKDRRYFAVRKRDNPLKKVQGKQLKLFPMIGYENDYRFSVYITNYDEDIISLWRRYRSRADDENRIKELKEDFGLEGFSMKKFYATESAMLIRVLLYNIYNLFRHEILPKAEQGKRIITLRFKYFVIPAITGIRGNQTILRLGIKSKSLITKFRYLFSAIKQWVSPVNFEMQCI